MKLRISIELFNRLRHTGELTGLDMAEIVRRCLRRATRMNAAELGVVACDYRDLATRDASTVIEVALEPALRGVAKAWGGRLMAAIVRHRLLTETIRPRARFIPPADHPYLIEEA